MNVQCSNTVKPKKKTYCNDKVMSHFHQLTRKEKAETLKKLQMCNQPLAGSSLQKYLFLRTQTATVYLQRESLRTQLALVWLVRIGAPSNWILAHVPEVAGFQRNVPTPTDSHYYESSEAQDLRVYPFKYLRPLEYFYYTLQLDNIRYRLCLKSSETMHFATSLERHSLVRHWDIQLPRKELNSKLRQVQSYVWH